jgi:nitrogenase molybdenum-iron protein beta chain
MNDDGCTLAQSSANAAKVFIINAAGFKGNSSEGAIAALNTLMDAMSPKEVICGSINLIGMFSDDYRAEADLSGLASMLDGIAKVNAVLPYDTFAHVLNAPAAELNVVFEGFETVGKTLANLFGTPYVTLPYPYGLKNSRNFVNVIAQKLHLPAPSNPGGDELCALKQMRVIRQYLNDIKDMPIAIMLDKVRLSGLSSFLRNELGLSVEVAFDVTNSTDQVDFEKTVQNSNAIMLVGSSLVRTLSERLDIPFLPLTHPVLDRIAISKNGYAGFVGVINLIEDILNAILEYRTRGTHNKLGFGVK